MGSTALFYLNNCTKYESLLENVSMYMFTAKRIINQPESFCLLYIS